MAKSIKDSLITKGHVERAWMGIYIQELNKDLAKSFGYEGTKGVLIGSVNKGSPAEKAGLKDGDIITKYADTTIEKVPQLRQLVATSVPNSKVLIEVFRGGKRLELTAVVGEQEAQALTSSSHEQTGKLGLTVRNVTPELAQKLGLDENKGVLIGEVASRSFAAHAGLHPGDIVTSINGTPVNDMDSFQAEAKKHDVKDGLRLQVLSEGMSHYVLLKEHAMAK